MKKQTSPLIAILTDFGTKDAYVAMMKAVALRICPDARFVDITHEIAPQNIQQAAYVLWTAYRYFPQRTVFLVVVDPGVGSPRYPVAIQAGPFQFVGPDNGVFTPVLNDIGRWQAVAIDEQAMIPEGLTATFHGRDLFAPTAAHLACGVNIETLGTSLDSLITLPVPHFQLDEKLVEGETIYTDHFGNVVTSIGRCQWLDDGTLQITPPNTQKAHPVVLQPQSVEVRAGSHTYTGIARTYAEAAPGEAVPIINSAGHLEIAVNQGSAQQQLGLSVGERVTVHLKD